MPKAKKPCADRLQSLLADHNQNIDPAILPVNLRFTAIFLKPRKAIIGCTVKLSRALEWPKKQLDALHFSRQAGFEISGRALLNPRQPSRWKIPAKKSTPLCLLSHLFSRDDLYQHLVHGSVSRSLHATLRGRPALLFNVSALFLCRSSHLSL